MVERLKITIERMRAFPPASLGPVMEWLSDLPYPWCAAEAAAERMPNLQGMTEIADYITHVHGADQPV